MQIIGIEGMSGEELMTEVERGGRFVIFQYCVSILILTFRQPTNIYFLRGDEGAFSKSIGPTIVSLLFGWWGIPWGPIFTIMVLVNNFSGGKDVTSEVLASLEQSMIAEEEARDRAVAAATATAVE